MTDKKFKTFKAFYPFYLSQHQNSVCRGLHYVGSTFVLLILTFAIIYQQYSYLLLLPLIGYGFAWVGHFFFEKNRPATFVYPWYSFLGDWFMCYQFLTGKLQKPTKKQ